MIMNEPKRFHIEPFYMLTKNPKGFLLLNSVQNLLGVPNT